jgi:hypothetical protein
MNNSLLILFLLIIFFIIFLGIILHFTSLKNRVATKNLSAVNRLKKSISYSVEDGKGVHLSIGKSDLANLHGAASLISLETTKKIMTQSSLSDNPPTITSGSGEIALLSQIAIVDSFNSKSRINPSAIPNAYLSGPTNLSYIAGAIPPTGQKNLSSQVFVGNIGSEIGLILHESNRRNHFSLSATDDLEGQAVSYVYANEAIIGDQIFSLPNQLDKEPSHSIAIIIHDVLRWVIIATILIIALLKISGIV